MPQFLLAAALAASQPAPVQIDADLRCVAAFAAAADVKDPAQAALLPDPELEERAFAHLLLVRERMKLLPDAERQASASAFTAAIEEANQSAQAAGSATAALRERVERCRPTIDAALSPAAARLSVPPEKLPLAYLRCTMVYAMFHGVAYRADSPHGLHGARTGQMFSKLYAERRFTGAATAEQKAEIWKRDVQAVEAERPAADALDDRQQCLLLATSQRGG